MKKPLRVLFIAVHLIVSAGFYGSTAPKPSQNPIPVHIQDESDIPLASASIEFVDIPAGEFNMGCDVEEGKSEGHECYNAETRSARETSSPIHRVVISKPFQMAKLEITQRQWKSIMTTNPSHFHGSLDLPVENVTRREVFAFLKALNNRGDGYHYRLPTEAEWEYAARAGDDRVVETGSIRYLFRDSEDHLAHPYTGKQPEHDDTPTGSLDDKAWYSNNSGGHTHPVGQKKPNKWRLHDMLGNVAEFVQDYYSRFYEPDPLIDPQGYPAAAFGLVVRGGSWQLGSQHSNVWARLPVAGSDLDSRSYTWIGFRCVRQKVDLGYSAK